MSSETLNFGVPNDEDESEDAPSTEHTVREVLINQIRKLFPSCSNVAKDGENASSRCTQMPSRRFSKADVANQRGASGPIATSERNIHNVRVLHMQAAQARSQHLYRQIGLFEPESEVEITIAPPPGPTRVITGSPPIAGAPPSYSAVMRIGGSFTEILPPPFIKRKRDIQIQPSPPFIAPYPPPSYAEAEGYQLELATQQQSSKLTT